MKHTARTLIFILVLTTLLVSACAGAAPASNSADKVQADLVEFTGVIEAINGTQWTINGQVVTVDPAVIRDGSFKVGDTVKLEARVAQDGSVTVTRVEIPSAPTSADNGNTNSADNGNSNTNTNSNSNLNDNSSTPVPLAGTLVFDDSGNEAFGPVDSITADTVVIGGQTFAITNGSEFKDQIQAGNFVKVHFVLNADGTYSIVEIENWDPALVRDGNSNSNPNSNLNSNTNSNNNGDDHSSNGNGNGDDDDNNSNGNDDSHDDSGNGNSNGNGNG
jgi:hypothetical protein